MWLLQEGPNARKHKEWIHPIVTFVVHYAVVTTSMIFVHDALVDAVSKQNGNTDEKECIVSPELIRRRQIVARFLAMYFLLYFCVRLALRWKDQRYLFYSEFYQSTFMCSVTIVNASFSFFYNRPIVAQAFCIAIGIDQLLW